jgi:ribosomal protein S18 acetylase RimI-like enzyme
LTLPSASSAALSQLITKIDNRLRDNATIIHRVLHDAYVREAALIEAEEFPPLRRTVDDVTASHNQFFGYRRDGVVCAIIELEPLSHHGLERTLIASLGVSPHAIRKGMGRALVEHALLVATPRVAVSTAERNKPAICLYESLGFLVRRRYTAPDGTPLVELEHGDE